MIFDYSIIRKTGLGQREFADLVNASRVSVSNWMAERTEPSKHLEKAVRLHLTLLTAAYRLGTLPGDIPTMHKSNVAARKKYIYAKLADASKKLKAKQKAKSQKANK